MKKIDKSNFQLELKLITNSLIVFAVKRRSMKETTNLQLTILWTIVTNRA